MAVSSVVRIAVASFAVVFVLGCREAAAPPPQLQAVKVALVERSGAGTAMRYSAHIAPATRLDMAFKVGGYVDVIATKPGVDGKPRIVQEGDTVTEGQALASVRKTDYAQHLQEAQAAFEQARAAAEQARLDLDRTAALTRSGATTDAELEAARTKLTTTRAAMAGARVRVNEAFTALADTTLRPPLSGTVLERAIEVGTLAAPGTIAFTIADVSTVKAIFAVPDTILPRVQLGAVQVVTTEAFPDVQFQGRITRISPSADPTSRVFEAEVSIPNADGRLRSGMVAALSLDAVPEAQPAAASALVPLPAIVRAPGKQQAFAVFVVDTDRGRSVARLREVELGDYLGRVIPVHEGLVGGEHVVVLGAGLLSDGEPVEIIP